jgi:hypothetical protein
LGIRAKAKNGGARSLSYLYWGWIRQIAVEEGLILPKSGSETDRLSAKETRELASALRARADKIRKGLAPRDASSYVRRIDKDSFPKAEREKAGAVSADFDDPDSIDRTANFFDSSGGVTLTY